MRRSEGDADGEDVRETRDLIGARPVLGSPLVEGLCRVVGVDLHEAIRRKELLADVSAGGVVGLQIHASEGRQQHGEVELE